MTARRLPAVAALLSLCATALTACGGDPDEPLPEPVSVAGPMWQVTDIYTTPGEPSSVPPGAAGAVGLIFGSGSATGSTGCAPIQARVEYSADGKPATVDDADAVTFDIVDLGPVEGECAGSDAWTHGHMTELIVPGAQFDMSMTTPTELVLRVRDEAVDPPSIRLVAL
ncbi:MAG: hypothetical protein Q4F37_07345 [Corynebacterium sp.]|uniref:hypothetical protein n=1 Tax=Corynebacterium sp. TaxID=1720 RepID=UPI0026FD1861|nr:hypothetical protein [Corynebacterium sp.]